MGTGWKSLRASPSLELVPSQRSGVGTGTMSPLPHEEQLGTTLTSRCSLQILQSQMAWGRLLVLSTPHLVQTFCGENKKCKASGGSGN